MESVFDLGGGTGFRAKTSVAFVFFEQPIAKILDHERPVTYSTQLSLLRSR